MSMEEVKPLWNEYHEETTEEYDAWLNDLSNQVAEKGLEVGP